MHRSPCDQADQYERTKQSVRGAEQERGAQRVQDESGVQWMSHVAIHSGADDGLSSVGLDAYRR